MRFNRYTCSLATVQHRCLTAWSELECVNPHSLRYSPSIVLFQTSPRQAKTQPAKLPNGMELVGTSRTGGKNCAETRMGPTQRQYRTPRAPENREYYIGCVISVYSGTPGARARFSYESVLQAADRIESTCASGRGGKTQIYDTPGSAVPGWFVKLESWEKR